MSRVFSTSEPCLEDWHRMSPPERRLILMRSMVGGAYRFVLFAPRQTGKTALVRFLSRSPTAKGHGGERRTATDRLR